MYSKLLFSSPIASSHLFVYHLDIICYCYSEVWQQEQILDSNLKTNERKICIKLTLGTLALIFYFSGGWGQRRGARMFLNGPTRDIFLEKSVHQDLKWPKHLEYTLLEPTDYICELFIMHDKKIFLQRLTLLGSKA